MEMLETQMYKTNIRLPRAKWEAGGGMNWEVRFDTYTLSNYI